jgi:pimeloyl-ACP methyl ester carboxylesterase
VFDLWIEHGLRELPTALYPDMPQVVNLPFSTQQASADTTPVDQPESVKQVTLTTTKHQEVFTFKRPMHPAAHQPLSSFTPTRLTHPDVSTYDPAATVAYSPEASAVFAQLPLLRPRCFYVFGETSTASSRQVEEEKLRVTGTGIGGSGGTAEGAVQSVLVKGAGHFVPFERPQEVAEVVAKWIGTDLKLWHNEQTLLRESWDQVKGQAKFTLSEDWKWWMQQGQAPGRPRVSKL